LGTQWALEVRTHLAGRGQQVAVLHLAQYACVSDLRVREALCLAERLIVIEDHYQHGGLADAMRRQFPKQSVMSVGWPRGWAGASGETDVLRTACGVDTNSIVEVVSKELARERGSRQLSLRC